MTYVRHRTSRKTYVYDTREGIPTHRTLGNETRLGKPPTRPREGAATPFSHDRALSVVFSADAQEDCPFRSGDSVHRADAAGRRAGSSPHSMTDTSDDLRTDDTASRINSYTSYTLRGRPEVYEKTARRRRGIAARTLRTLRSQRGVYHTREAALRYVILSSQNEVYEVYERVSPPSRPTKISYTSPVPQNVHEVYEPQGGVTHV